METKAMNTFRSVVKGRNFMTPDIIDYLEIPGGAVEFSKGTGMFGGTIYGVSVVKNGRQVLSTEPNGGRCFESAKDAAAYILTLQEAK